jgi:hypothetical protein
MCLQKKRRQASGVQSADGALGRKCGVARHQLNRNEQMCVRVIRENQYHLFCGAWRGEIDNNRVAGIWRSGDEAMRWSVF